MIIRVQLFATLSPFLPEHAEGDAVSLTMDSGATVAKVLDLLRIPPGFPCLTVVNGRDADSGQVLADGDTVTLFPPLAGG